MFSPDRLKYAIIRPLFKKGNNNMSNYRPISILTSSKMFEKVMQTGLLKHLTDQIDTDVVILFNVP